jgi:mannose-6-phosphate isomerase-like protein (cupin superfamily)
MTNLGASDPVVWVPKGWGGETIVVNSNEYCGKILHFVKGHRCSWHYHEIKDETFYVYKGAIELTYGETDDITDATTVVLAEGDKFHITRGLRHQMYALLNTELLEFSTRHYDEDSHRVEKGD